jgi:carboxypeptidase C (cathepsin A)
MKIIISIILALIVSLLAASNTATETPPVAAENPPQTATTIYVEYTSETMITTAEKAIVSETAEKENTATTTKPTTTTCKTKVNQTEGVTEEYTEVTDLPTMSEELVECMDKGNQGLVEYKPQIGGQPNPFENDLQTEIKEHPVEEYITEGGYRPGEGIHF